MGFFSKAPNTINDKQWARIQRGANKTEARQGGMFSKKAVERRKIYNSQKDKSRWS